MTVCATPPVDAPARDWRVRHLGRQAYEPVWRAMQRFTDARGPDTEDELWIVEHDPVFTLGQAGKPEHVLAPGDIPVIRVDRGGQVTYHGPGQVVAYPLVDLRRLGLGVRELVCRIEGAVIDVLAGYGIRGERKDGAPGIYVGGAIGLGYVPSALAAPGTQLTIDCRGKDATATVVSGKFYKRPQ